MPYEKKVLRYKQNGKYGLIDYEGKVITKPIYEEIEGLDEEFHLCDDEQQSTEEEHHQHEEQEHTGISFKGHGRCKLCGCGKWAGYGNVCKNCGHFFDKHYSL